MDGPKKNIPVREVLAFVAHAGHLRELVEGSIELFKQPVGGVEAVLGDKLPDLLKVAKGAPGKFELLHARCRRRSAL